MANLQIARDNISGLNPNASMWPGLRLPHQAWGDVGTKLDTVLRRLMKDGHFDHATGRPVASVRTRVQQAAQPLGERLFESLATAKIMTSRVSMHLGDSQRRWLFAELDRLMELEGWHEDDPPLYGASFETFLKFIIFVAPSRAPMLGISNDGNLLAAWKSERDVLTLEFVRNDQIRWVLVRYSDGERETAAGQGAISRIVEVLSPYGPKKWFGDADGHSWR